MPNQEKQLDFPFMKAASKPEENVSKEDERVKSNSGENYDSAFHNAMMYVFDGEKDWWKMLSARIAKDYESNPRYFLKVNYDKYARTILGYKEKHLSDGQFKEFAGICGQLIKKHKRNTE